MSGRAEVAAEICGHSTAIEASADDGRGAGFALADHGPLSPRPEMAMGLTWKVDR
jgi:hypothetical protein